MKKILLATVAFLVAVHGLNAQNSAAKIPSDALMVLSLNFSNLNKKIDVDRIKSLDVVNMAFQQTKRSFGKDSSVVEKIYKSPKSYGVDLEPSAKFFLRNTKDNDGATDYLPVFMVNLSKSKKFEKLLKTLFDEGDEYKEFLEVKEGYKYYRASRSVIIWTKSTAYFFPISYNNRDVVEENISSLMNVSNSLISNKSYLSSKISSNDVSYWLDYNKLLEIAKEQNKDEDDLFYNFNSEKLKGTETSISLNFAKGALLFDILGKTNEEIRLENALIYNKKVNPEFFNYVSNDSLIGLFSGALDVKELKNYVEKNYEKVLDSLEHKIERSILEDLVDTNEVLISLREQLKSDSLDWRDRWPLYDSIRDVEDSLVEIEMKKIDETIDSTLNEFNLTRDQACDFFKGDFMFASTGVYQVLDTVETIEYTENEYGEFEYTTVEVTKEVPAPLIVAMATVNLVDKCSSALEKLESEGLIKKEEGKDYYYITVTKYDFFIKLSGNVLIYTSDRNIVELPYIQGKNIYNDAIDEKILSNALSSVSYGYVNIDKIIKRIPSEGQSARMIDPLKETFNYLEFSSNLNEDKDISTNLSLNFMKENDNSLHILLDLANEYFKLYSGM